MYVYLDESGDLGFGQGGSRYFTISFVVVKDQIHFIICVKEVKIKYYIPRNVELKGSNARESIKEDLLNRFAKLDMEVHAITVRKKNIEAKLRKDMNLLYNYMVGLLLVERILAEAAGARVSVNVDRRVISVTALPIHEYLKYKTWYEGQRQDIDLEISHLDSHQAYAIQG